MNPGQMVTHLERRHPEIDWVEDLDADEMNRLHHDAHGRHLRDSHVHRWAGRVADPQGPIRGIGDERWHRRISPPPR